MGQNNGFQNVDKRTITTEGHFGPKKNFLTNAGFLFELKDVSTSGLVAAYDHRRLRQGYTANIADYVRRSNDNYVQPFGFNQEAYNKAGLLVHTGSNSGYVSTFADQSGNGRDLIQYTNSLQPRIVNAGAVDQIGSIPAMQGIPANATYIQYTAGSNFMTGTDATMFLVCSIGTTGGYDRLVSGSAYNSNVDNGSGGFDITSGNSNNSIAFVGGSNNYVWPNATQGNVSGTCIVSVVCNSTSATIRVNGGLARTENFVTTFALGKIALMASPGGGNHTNQKVSAFYLFSRALGATERAVIENNLIAYYA